MPEPLSDIVPGIDRVPIHFRWRDVYVTNSNGELVRVVRCYTPQEANLRNIPYIEHWREALLAETIKPNDNLLVDDGYIVPVLSVGYGVRPFIMLATSKYCIPRDIDINDFFITSKPHWHKITRVPAICFKEQQNRMRAVVVRYLNNGFDKVKAYYDFHKEASKIKPENATRFFFTAKSAVYSDE